MPMRRFGSFCFRKGLSIFSAGLGGASGIPIEGGPLKMVTIGYDFFKEVPAIVLGFTFRKAFSNVY